MCQTHCIRDSTEPSQKFESNFIWTMEKWSERDYLKLRLNLHIVPWTYHPGLHVSATCLLPNHKNPRRYKAIQFTHWAFSIREIWIWLLVLPLPNQKVYQSFLASVCSVNWEKQVNAAWLGDGLCTQTAWVSAPARQLTTCVTYLCIAQAFWCLSFFTLLLPKKDNNSTYLVTSGWVTNVLIHGNLSGESLPCC